VLQESSHRRFHGSLQINQMIFVIIFSKGWQLMISGVQKAMISGWYPVDILDIRMWYSVETWLFSAIFQVFQSLDLCPLIWLIYFGRCIQQIFFNILLKFVRYLIKICSIFSWCPFIIHIISGWYPWHPDIRCTDSQQGVTPCFFYYLLLFFYFPSNSNKNDFWCQG